MILLSVSSAVSAQSWAELYTSAQDAYQNGEHETALAQADQCLTLFLKEADQSTDNHAAILRLLQVICYENGDYERGLDYASKEVVLRESQKDEQYAAAVGQAGSFQLVLGDFDAAESAFREALSIYSQFYQPSEPVVVETSLNIGISLYNLGKEDEAYRIFRQYLTSTPQEITSAVLQSSYFFGELSLDRGETADAERSFDMVKTFYEGEGLTESPDYAALLISLAQISHERQAWEEADQLYQSAQTIYEHIGRMDADYFRLLNARAVNFQRMRQPEKADELLSRIPQDALKGDLAAVILSNRAMASKGSNDLVTAEKYYREALAQLDSNVASQRKLYSETLQNLAVVLSEEEKGSEALSVLMEAEGMMNGSDSMRIASLQVKKGLVLLKTSDPDGGFRAFSKALNIILLKDRKFSPEWVMAMNGIGSAYSTKGNISAADSVFGLVVSAYKSGIIKPDGNYPVVLNNHASVQQMKGQVQVAYDLFYEAAQYLKQEAGVNTLVYASTLENLAHVNINRGMVTVAKGQIDSAVAIIEKILGAESLQYASAQVTLGRYFQSAGDFPSAEPCFKKAYSLLNAMASSAPSTQVARATNALAIFYQTMGNYEEAEPLFKELLAQIEKEGRTETSDYSTTLQNLATLYQMQEKLELASPLLERALAIDEKVFGTNHPQYIVALKNLGVLYQKQGKLSDAQRLLERALEVTRKVHGEDHPSYAVTVSNLAALYQDQGKYDEAEKAWQQSVELRKRILGEEHPDYARSLYGLASIYFATGNLEKADEYFKTVISQYLRQIKENFPFMSEKEKGAFYHKIQPVLETYQDFCVQFVNKDPGSATSVQTLFDLYNLQLFAKAILLNSTTKVRRQILATNDAQTIEVYSKWLATKETIGRYYTLTAEERAGHEDIKALQAVANELEKELTRTSEIFRRQYAQPDYTAEDVRNALADGEAALEIIRIRKKFVPDSVYYVGVMLRKDQPEPALVIWPSGTKLETRHYLYQRNTIRFSLEDRHSYNHFWKPLEKVLGGITHLYVSSDGVFNKMNLATLRNPVTNRWVLDDYTISLVSNTREILERNVADQALTNDAHLFGYVDFNLSMDANHVADQSNSMARKFGFEGTVPLLPGTEVEVNQIRDLMKASALNVSAHMRNKATEEALKSIVNPKILHIATHGFFLNDVDLSDTDDDDASKFMSNPLVRSGLLLAGATVKEDNTDATTVEDGILTAYEAMSLTLDHTDLVVMSACETGLGEVRNGEGVYGLQRSFLVAGASAVLMSLWQVDDRATQELMVQFYNHWLAGDSKLVAFRKAQIAMKEKYPSPYYWGAFIMIGY